MGFNNGLIINWLFVTNVSGSKGTQNRRIYTYSKAFTERPLFITDGNLGGPYSDTTSVVIYWTNLTQFIADYWNAWNNFGPISRHFICFGV